LENIEPQPILAVTTPKFRKRKYNFEVVGEWAGSAEDF
jgi:hypothetical protein